MVVYKFKLGGRWKLPKCQFADLECGFLVMLTLSLGLRGGRIESRFFRKLDVPNCCNKILKKRLGAVFTLKDVLK